jgi:PTS system arbutin-like IIC component
MFTQIGIGICFTGIYFVVFKTLIERLNLKTRAAKRAKSNSTARPTTRPLAGKPPHRQRQASRLGRQPGSCRRSAVPAISKA